MVQLAIEAYYEKYNVLPINQDRDTLFAWMNGEYNHPIERQEFDELWQSMTLCADCGHCVGYIPGC